jgi:putative tryptophan/tyrosine transport system substrate-binding protein
MAPPTIGFLGATSKQAWTPWYNAFTQQLKTNGTIATTGATITELWADGLDANYTGYAATLVGQGVSIIVTGGTGATIACRDATASMRKPIPVVFATAGDPVNCVFPVPAGNLTGFSNEQSDLVQQRLSFVLTWLKPDLGTINLGILGNSAECNVQKEMNLINQLAPALGFGRLTSIPITSSSTIAQIKILLQAAMKPPSSVNVVYVCTDPYVTTIADQLNPMMHSLGLPEMHAFGEYVTVHQGLMSYGPNFQQLFVNAADLVQQILVGGKSASSIPVTPVTAFESHGSLAIARQLHLNKLVANTAGVTWWQ